MITEEEYLKARQIVQEYEKQLNISDVMCCDCGKLIGESQSKYRCQDCYEDYMEK